MIGIICYIIGIFITPIILKKFFKLPENSEIEPFNKEMIIVGISLWWPIAFISWLLLKILYINIWIYNKI